MAMLSISLLVLPRLPLLSASCVFVCLLRFVCASGVLLLNCIVIALQLASIAVCWYLTQYSPYNVVPWLLNKSVIRLPLEMLATFCRVRNVIKGLEDASAGKLKTPPPPLLFFFFF